ncbi:MAG TPA: ABC transporter ATP-binding protein, partial [Candidatus Omnitrophota bacterium]|nr:ABC transporter ATP-binding protein [Candidatus Omnitrophota bacterium]
ITGKNIALPPGVAPPAFIQLGIDKVNELPRIQLLNIMTVIVVVIFICKGLFEYLKTYLMSDVSERVIRDVKNDIYRKLQDLSMDFFSHNPTGKLMSRITHDAAVIRDSIGSGVADTFSQPIELFFYIVLLVGLKMYGGVPWSFILVSVVVFPLILLPVVRIGKRLRKISRTSQEQAGDINNMLLETISGIKLVKSFGMEDYECESFRKKNQEYYDLTIKSIKKMKMVSPLTESMMVVCVAAILWIAGRSMISGELSFGVFAAFLAAIFSLMKPFKKLSNVYGINQQALAAADRIFQLYDTPVSIKERPGARKLEKFTESISFEKVWFKYEKDFVLEDINLTVKKGEILALVGPSGGGKSTLVNLIPRFYDPVSGSVRVDGQDIRELDIRSLRDKIGLVTQETLLFNDTVRANICYGHTDVDEKQLIAVSKAANAHMFIKDFPQGYDTVIGERGLKISGGQRQRIAIARAIYKNPPILIFDEATSQLDTESEKLVQEAINNLVKGRTVIVIAHRLSTVKHANKIVVISGGKISDSGSHEDLLRKNPLYKKLYTMQFAEGEEAGLEP